MVKILNVEKFKRSKFQMPKILYIQNIKRRKLISKI